MEDAAIRAEQTQKLRARPTRVTVMVIVLAVVGVLQSLGALYALVIALGLISNPVPAVVEGDPQLEMIKQATSALTPKMALIGVLGNAVFWLCLVGFWRMKKWAVLLYAALTAINLLIVLVLRPAWMVYDPKRSWVGFVLAAIVLAILVSCWREMSPRRPAIATAGSPDVA